MENHGEMILMGKLVIHPPVGSVVVSVLATVPKGHRFKPGRGDGFSRAIKIYSTPSFSGK
jgi:hypothetical protein